MLINSFNIMPITGTVNTQQVLQMGTLTEKLQQTLQQLPTITSQQLQDEQGKLDELKRAEIQDPENPEAANPTDPEGQRRRQAGIRKKAAQEDESAEPSKDADINAEPHSGAHVNLRV